jgi:seryl-tRNA synthetase
MTRMTGVDGGQALAFLDPAETALVAELDRTFRDWAADAGAVEISAPPLYPVTDLEKFDVYQNFPHLALVAGPLELTQREGKPVDGRFGPADLVDGRYGLPHATCYGAYLYHEGGVVDGDTVVTLVNRCFRNEDHFGGLRRLVSFQMREIVAIGTFEHTQDLIARHTGRIADLGAALGLSLEQVAATDPFFAKESGRALLQRLHPVKHEFQHDGLAIASVNTHRNFFGERCDIRLRAGGQHAYTSCVAFGLERWLAVLTDRHGDADTARTAVLAATGRTP